MGGILYESVAPRKPAPRTTKADPLGDRLHRLRMAPGSDGRAETLAGHAEANGERRALASVRVGRVALDVDVELTTDEVDRVEAGDVDALRHLFDEREEVGVGAVVPEDVAAEEAARDVARLAERELDRRVLDADGEREEVTLVALEGDDERERGDERLDDAALDDALDRLTGVDVVAAVEHLEAEGHAGVVGGAVPAVDDDAEADVTRLDALADDLVEVAAREADVEVDLREAVVDAAGAVGL